MSVYVDRLFECAGRRGWPFRKACHLYADTLDELHEYAGYLGLKREWFQNRKNFPHYDLTATKRALALRLGVIEANRKHGCEFRRRWREKTEADA